MTFDVISHLAFDTEDPALDLRRPVARSEAQRSFDSLFSPVDDRDYTVAERWVVAAFATALTADDDTAAYYLSGVRAHAAQTVPALQELIAQSSVAGPYGIYPEAGLVAENVDGLRLAVPSAVFGIRLAAALEHTHLLVKRPREATGQHQQRLLEAGWHPNGIITLSQLVAFLSFQQRVVIGLRALNAESIS